MSAQVIRLYDAFEVYPAGADLPATFATLPAPANFQPIEDLRTVPGWEGDVSYDYLHGFDL